MIYNGVRLLHLENYEVSIKEDNLDTSQNHFSFFCLWSLTKELIKNMPVKDNVNTGLVNSNSHYKLSGEEILGWIKRRISLYIHISNPYGRLGNQLMAT